MGSPQHEHSTMDSHPLIALFIGRDRSDLKADFHLIHTPSVTVTKPIIDTSPEVLHDGLAKPRAAWPQQRDQGLI